MNIDPIKDGIVIDHIDAGKSMEIYNQLGLDSLDCSVAVIKNAHSNRMGRKDIIKIDRLLDIDFDVLGFIDPDVTVNIIRDGKTIDKKQIALPKRITGVLKCKNPRCITTIEQELPQIFELRDADTKTYRCIYCEADAK